MSRIAGKRQFNRCCDVIAAASARIFLDFELAIA
jgi:hypothetical protein